MVQVPDIAKQRYHLLMIVIQPDEYLVATAAIPSVDGDERVLAVIRNRADVLTA
jgi:hypothetical protein